MRKIWIILLALGAVAGFAAGFRSLHRWGHDFGHGSWHGTRRAAFEAHVADVCTQAAERVIRERAAVGDRAPAPP